PRTRPAACPCRRCPGRAGSGRCRARGSPPRRDAGRRPRRPRSSGRGSASRATRCRGPWGRCRRGPGWWGRGRSAGCPGLVAPSWSRLVERRGTREDARADLVESPREARPLDVVQVPVEDGVLLEGVLELGVELPEACVLGGEAPVLGPGVEEPVRPVRRIAEWMGYSVRGDLE